MFGLLPEETLTKGRMRGLLSGVSSFFNLRSVLPTANVPAHRSAGHWSACRRAHRNVANADGWVSVGEPVRGWVGVSECGVERN